MSLFSFLAMFILALAAAVFAFGALAGLELRSDASGGISLLCALGMWGWLRDLGDQHE